MVMAIGEDMSEQMHPEFAGKCAVTTFIDKCYHTVVSIHDPWSAVNVGEI